MSRRWSMVGALCATAVLAGTLFGGCSKAPYKVVPVSGKVTLDGKGVPNLIVQFSPVVAADAKGPRPPASSGTTNDQGEYDLTVYDPSGKKTGAVVGKHQVAFMRTTAGSGGPLALATWGADGARPRPRPDHCPLWEVPVAGRGPRGRHQASHRLRAAAELRKEGAELLFVPLAMAWSQRAQPVPAKKAF